MIDSLILLADILWPLAIVVPGVLGLLWLSLPSNKR